MKTLQLFFNRLIHSLMPRLATVILVVCILCFLSADAVRANDLSKVRLLLPKQGATDFGEVSYNEFLDLAADKFAEVAGTPAAHERVSVIAELSRHLRHIIGKSVIVTGTIGVNLINHGSGNFTPAMTMKSKNGITYRLGISADETEYKNTSIKGQQFSVDFDSTYKIHGVVVDDFLEAEEVELLTEAKSGHGIVVPVSLLLPSTMDVLLPHLKQDQPALVSDAAKNGDLRMVKVLLKRNRDLVFSKDERGATPLFWAAFYGHKDVAEFLLANGADVNAKEIHGETPLASATKQDVAELLRQHGGHK